MASDFEFDHGNLVKLTCIDGSAFDGMGIDSEIDCVKLIPRRSAKYSRK